MLKTHFHSWVMVCLLGFACVFGSQAQERSGSTQAQQPQAPVQQSAAAVGAEPEAPRVVLQAETTASVLRLMKFSGALRDPAGNPRAGAVGLTFALYKEQQGGSPLWLEVHNAQLDEQGRYTVLLGSTKSEGLPLELFSSGEARWLGVQLNLPGEEEQARVLLVSVPYALKAADAETLGGKPPSAFLLADPVGADLRVRPEAGKEAVKEGPPREGVVGPINGEGTVDSLAKFTGANAIGNAGIVEVSGKVGIGTASPNVKLSLGTDLTAQKLALWDGAGDFYGLGVQAGRVVLHTANTERMAITSDGRVGIGTAAPGAKLAVTGAGTGDARFGDPGCGGNYTGIWLNQLTADCTNYNLTSSPSDQTLYVNRPAGAGIEFREGNTAQMVVKAGGKVGIGTTAPNVKLSLGTDITAQKLALYDGLGDFYGLGVQGGRIVVHTGNTERMAITSAGNVGIGTAAPSQKFEVNGNVKISGGGNGIIFPDATVQTTAGGGGTATDLNCAAPCVSSAEVDFNFAGSSSKGGIATNADLLDGLDSTAFAVAAHNHDSTYVNVTGDTMSGALNLPANGLTVGADQLVLTGGNVGIGTATPSSILSLGGNVDRTFGMERHTVADTSGNDLTLRAGGATSGATNKTGGNLLLSAGISTGNEGSLIAFLTAPPGVSGTADHGPSTKMIIDGNGNVGIGTPNPAQKLEVVGNVKILGGGNGIIFPDATVQTTAGGGGTATDLNCAAPCVSSAEVDFNYAGSSSKGGIASNADLLDGLDSAAFAVAAHNHDATYVNVSGDTMAGTLNLPANGLVVGTNQMVVSGGNLGIGTATPSTSLSLGGEVSRTFGLERRTFADSSGGSLVVRAGAATLGATDKFGGGLILSGGISTGSGDSEIRFQTATPGAAGTTDNAPTTKMTIVGDGNVGIGTIFPGEKLEVAGKVKISGSGNGLMFPDGSLQTTASGTATDLNCAAPCVSTAELVDLSVVTSKLANASVDSIKLANASVSTAKLADLSVDATKLANDSVSTGKIQDASVSTAKLADGSVTAGKLGSASVGTTALADASVTTSKVADATVTSAKVDFNFAGSSSKGGIATNADLLDGLDSTAFAVAAHNHDTAYVNVTGDTMAGTLNLPANGLVAGTTQLVLSGGNVGIGTAAPSTILSLGGEFPRTLGMERRILADASGGTLAIRAGGATVGATNKFGGPLILSSGISTGSVGSSIEFQTATPREPGTQDNIPTTKMTISNSGGVFLDGESGDKFFVMGPRTMPDTAGNPLTLQAGGATSGATDKIGGDLRLSGGRSTGNQGSQIQFLTATPGASGTAFHDPTIKMFIGGTGVTITGDLSVGGTVFKGGGSFRIDHPLDPAHKYLSHSFVESPDMMNIYNGNARLDSNGEAWVELPEWLEALNRDFRYQLTALGAPGPSLHIAAEVSGNRFKIAGGRPGGRVSWQVTGIRQDAYAQAHRIKVEQEKAEGQRGYYLHPELFGQPAERGIQWSGKKDPLRDLEGDRPGVLATAQRPGR